MQTLCYRYIGLYQYYNFGYANTLCVHYPLFFFIIFFTLLPKLIMLAPTSIAAKEYVSIASATFILCMLQLIRIAHPKCTTQRSESPNANKIALKNTKEFSFTTHFLFSEYYCYTDILCDCKYTIYLVYVACNQNRTSKRYETMQ